MITFNNQLMVEPYLCDKKLKANVTSGFATVQQKGSIVRLKILADAKIVVGPETIDIKKGSIAIIREELLYSQQSVLKQFDMPGTNSKFMLIDFSFIMAIE